MTVDSKWDDLTDQAKLDQVTAAISTQRPIGWRAALWLVERSGMAPRFVSEVRAGQDR